MKKLSKLKLNDFHEMSEMEMKMVFGGTGTTGTDMVTCSLTCGEETVTITCNPGATCDSEGDNEVHCSDEPKTRAMCLTTGAF